MARILVVVPIPMDEAGLRLREEQTRFARPRADSEFVYRSVAIGPRSFQGAHDLALMDIAVLGAAVSAEEEGFDAVCVDTMSDSGVTALQSVLRIPVIGAGRAAMMTALLLGARFSILVMHRPWIPIEMKTVKAYGLEDRLTSIRSIDVKPKPYGKQGGVATEDEEVEIFPLLLDAARQAMEDGAEVILLGSTTMYRAAEYLAERLPIPVLNAGPLTYRYAEMLVDLGLTHSNTSDTISPIAQPEMLAAMLEAGRNWQTAHPAG